MKINRTEPMRRSAVRTINAFTKELFRLIKVKQLENISIGELCDCANYPRSTFYNYFDDIYDLTQCLLENTASEMNIDAYREIRHGERTMQLFNRCYEYMKSMENSIDKILKHNNEDGKLMEILKKFINQKVKEIMETCPESEKFPIPYSIMIVHYCNTITELLEQCFLEKVKLSKEEALTYLDYLIGTLERNK